MFDPNGKGAADIVKGFVAAMTDYATFGVTNLRSRHETNCPDDFNRGLEMADNYMMAMAVAEITGGSGGTGAGIAVMSGSTVLLVTPGGQIIGAIGEVGGAIIAGAGVLIAGHGATMLQMATDNKTNKNGYRNEKARELRKLSDKEVGKVLGKGDKWHDDGKAKRSFLNKFRKELKGETNPDFYQDKSNNEIILRGTSNKKIEVETRVIIDLKN